MPLKAVIFDMDGVLSKTQKLHAKAQSEILKEETGKEMRPEKITEKYAGMEPGTFFEEEADAERPMDLHSRKQERLYELVEEEGVEPVPGAVELVEGLEDEFVLGVASGSQPEFIEKVLNSLGLEDYFDSFTSASEVERGKPAPDVFLEEAERLSVRPEDCLVIEDGSAGMNGANSAGMTSVGLSESECPADVTVTSLKELDAEKLNKFYTHH
ncbi:MAG: HAD family hydrolase [Candidatus Nanohalobium sp.]